MNRKITKSQLNQIIKESVDEVMLEEGFFDSVKNFGKNISRGADSLKNNFKNGEGKSLIKRGMDSFDKAKQTYNSSAKYEKLVGLSKEIKELINDGTISGKAKVAADEFVNTLFDFINLAKANTTKSSGRGKGNGYDSMNYKRSEHFA